MSRERIQIGVRRGGGPPPGFEWNVWLISFVVNEAYDVLGEDGYEHMKMQVRELALLREPSTSETVDVRPIEAFYEIRDRGGPFGMANVRLFFGLDDVRRVIVPLGSIKKQNNGQTPKGDLIRMRRRFRRYLNGDFGFCELK